MSIHNPSDEQIVNKFWNIRSSAIDRGIEFRMSLKEIRRLLSIKKCQITQVRFSNSGEDKQTFDRLDNDLGYVDGNVIVCTSRINKLKGNLDTEEITQIYNLLQKHRKKK